VRDDIARCAQKLHTPPRMVSLMTDSRSATIPPWPSVSQSALRVRVGVTVFRVWLRVPWSRTSVCCACVDVELNLYSRSYIFQSCNFQYRIFRSRIFHQLKTTREERGGEGEGKKEMELSPPFRGIDAHVQHWLPHHIQFKDAFVMHVAHYGQLS